MSFVSFRFWLVFPVIFLVYWAIPARYNAWRKVLLVLASSLRLKICAGNTGFRSWIRTTRTSTDTGSFLRTRPT